MGNHHQDTDCLVCGHNYDLVFDGLHCPICNYKYSFKKQIIMNSNFFQSLEEAAKLAQDNSREYGENRKYSEVLKRANEILEGKRQLVYSEGGGRKLIIALSFFKVVSFGRINYTKPQLVVQYSGMKRLNKAMMDKLNEVEDFNIDLLMGDVAELTNITTGELISCEDMLKES